MNFCCNVYAQDTRTTGAAEAFNGKCGRSFKTHGNFFNFLAVYQREELTKTNELELDVRGVLQKDTQKKKYRDRSSIIEQYSKLLKANKISVRRFLVIMSNMDNKIVYDEHEYPKLDIEDIEFESSDDMEKYKSMTQPIPVCSNSSSTVSNTPEMDADVNEVEAIDDVVAVVQEQGSGRKAPLSKAAVENEKSNGSSSKGEPSSNSQRKKRKRVVEIEESDSDDEVCLVRSKRRKNVLMDSSHDSLDSSDSDLKIVTSITSMEAELTRLHKLFDEIILERTTVNSKAKRSSKCIMECGRVKATVLQPCQHQATCNQCFVFWKLHLVSKSKTIFCPICRATVKKHVASKK